MKARFWIPVVLGLCFAAPAAAQAVIWHTEGACSRERYRPPRRRAAEARRDTAWTQALDSIRADLSRSARAAGAVPEGLFMVDYDVRARTGRMWMAQGSIPASVLQAVYTRAEPALRTYPYAQRGRVMFHARLEEIAEDSIRPGDVVEECRPEVRNEAEIRRMIADFAGRPNGSGSGPAQVLALIARDGQVVYTELKRTSGNGRVDQFALQLFARMQFSPGTVNGQPKDLWVEQPVVVQGDRRFP
ncbi:MAG TPA: energy transducer TonB [Longimicrobium sp.]|nr:energy transducer TonB [Longimicrobium sp.]